MNPLSLSQRLTLVFALLLVACCAVSGWLQVRSNTQYSQQVIQRLGTPKEFADSTAEQFGIDNASSKKRKGIISALVALIVAVVAFSIYAATRLGKAPEGAIGQADATTNIQIESALGFDVLQIILAVGFAAAVIAVLLIIRTIHKNRR